MKRRTDNQRLDLVVGVRHRLRLRVDLRKIRKAELVALAHDNGTIDRVLKLADVAGPLELRQMGHRLAADAANETVFFGAEPRQKVPQQMRDVFAPHPQGRNRQRQHVEAVEQIFAELSALDPLQQLAVGRRDDADVDLARLAPADRLHRAFLQRAKQFHLGCQRQFADFVEEQRAAGGLDEFAGVAFGGAGEGALLMAEQDRLHQIVGNGTAIHGHERL